MRSSGQIRPLERNFLNVKQVGSQEPWEADQGWVLRVQHLGRHPSWNIIEAHPSCVASIEHTQAKRRDQREPQMAGWRTEQLGDNSPVKFSMDLIHLDLQGTD